MFDDEASPLQPFVRARSVDVRFAPGSGFSENERICVSIPGVGAELQSSVGTVKAVNDDGSVEFAPDDAPDEIWSNLRVTDVVRRVPMAWILGFGVGLKPTRQPKKKDATDAYTKDAKVRNDSISHKGPASSSRKVTDTNKGPASS